MQILQSQCSPRTRRVLSDVRIQRWYLLHVRREDFGYKDVEDELYVRSLVIAVVVLIICN
eukprot:EC714814.1.p2 GENE.EC714814.1~~EC714814.1.p2  ORF type:complete len:60 (+),score=1.75 EC714814.1:187-366(+)